jgi:hypothetical protein
MSDLRRITERADAAIRKLNALSGWGYAGATKTTLHKVLQVVESQRDELLALHAFLDSIEGGTLPNTQKEGT